MEVTIRYTDSLTGEAVTLDAEVNSINSTSLIAALGAEDERNDPEAGAGTYWVHSFVPLLRDDNTTLAGFIIQCRPPARLTPSHVGGLDDYLIVGTITEAQ